MFRLQIALILIVTTNPIRISAGDGFHACTSNADCSDIPHTYCGQKKVCICQQGFYQDGYTKCYAKIDAPCNNNADCETLTNSNCQQHKCICNTNTVADPNGFACFPNVQYGYPCEEDIQCFKYMGSSYSWCNPATKVCDCKPDYHVKTNGVCILSKGLSEPCNSDDECYNGNDGYPPFKNQLVCKNNICSCKDGMIPSDDQYCKSDASTIVLHSFIIFIISILSIKNIF